MSKETDESQSGTIEMNEIPNEKGTSLNGVPLGLERSSSIRLQAPSQAPSQALVQEPQSKEPQSQEPQPPSQEMRRTWRSYLTYL